VQNTVDSGRLAESAAAADYCSRGFAIEARNFRLRSGEIDLIARRAGLLVFVEVKGRAWFRPEEAESLRWRGKKRRMARVAAFYLARRRLEMPAVDEFRLDIVYVTQGRVTERYEGEPFW
jgi:putative endonuclease